ncbi:MAG: hypothetical protein H7319_04040 [Spirosoma sp.]|nr:hypothetical protein [Spirosoma sp.]
MESFAPHPGIIRMIDDDTKEIRNVKAEEKSVRRQFVYPDRDDHEVEATDTNAVKRIPIVEVCMTPTDGKGNIVPRKQAKKMEIIEYGPDHRFLRSTLMFRNQ